MKSERQRLDYIDALRGVAILGVVVVHCGQVVQGLPPSFATMTSFGTVGVQLFFMLSALTLFTVYSKRSFSPTEFYIRRFFRIAPAFYFALLAYALLAYFSGSLALNAATLWRGVTTFFFIHSWLPETVHSMVPGGWSIGVEAMFYLIFPLCLRYITDLPRAIMGAAAALLFTTAYAAVIHRLLEGRYSAHVTDDFIYFGAIWNITPFMLGAVLFHGINLVDRRKTRIGGAKIWGAKIWGAWLDPACLALCTVFLLLASLEVAPFSRHLVVLPLVAWMVFLVRQTQTRLLVNAAMRHLGEISFSVYLVHFAVLRLCVASILPPLAPMDPILRVVILFAGVLGLSVVFAQLSWNFIEQPGIGLGKRVIDALRGRRRAVASPAG